MIAGCQFNHTSPCSHPATTLGGGTVNSPRGEMYYGGESTLRGGGGEVQGTVYSLYFEGNWSLGKIRPLNPARKGRWWVVLVVLVEDHFLF